MSFSPNKNLSVTKIPDSTPGIISLYALSDEQAQFMEHDLIALFAFERNLAEVTILREKHYQLVSAEQVTVADLRQYQERPLDES